MILRSAKDALGNQAASNYDWEDWMLRFNLVLFKESKSTALAAAQDLAMSHTPFARKLFNAAFVSAWAVLDHEQRALISEGMEKAMHHNQTFMQLMLSVAEF